MFPFSKCFCNVIGANLDEIFRVGGFVFSLGRMCWLMSIVSGMICVSSLL